MHCTAAFQLRGPRFESQEQHVPMTRILIITCVFFLIISFELVLGVCLCSTPRSRYHPSTYWYGKAEHICSGLKGSESQCNYRHLSFQVYCLKNDKLSTHRHKHCQRSSLAVFMSMGDDDCLPTSCLSARLSAFTKKNLWQRNHRDSRFKI